MAKRNIKAMFFSMVLLLFTLISSNTAYDYYKSHNLIKLIIWLFVTIVFTLSFEEYMRQLNK